MARISKERTEWATTDPEGRSLLLRTDDWVNHIITLHPEMFGYQDEIRITIEQPDEIQSRTVEGQGLSDILERVRPLAKLPMA